MLENTIFINLSLFLLDGASLLVSCYWSSSEGGDGIAWYVYMNRGTVGNANKGANCRVRAFLRV
jgi:hypothetical protein